MAELFSEVDEELRREQLRKVWSRYSGLIVGAAILIIVAVGGWRGYQYLEAQKAAQAGSAFEAAAALADQNKHAEAEAAFTKLAATAPRGYRNLSLLRAAAEAVKRDPKEAVKLYDAIAADSGFDGAERDLARVRAAGLLLDTETYNNMLQRLEPATAPEATFRHTAREMLALSAWHANDTASARKWLDAISADGQTPSSLRNRAEALQALLPPAAKS
ncbi:tetratricopeptide repeat protein [Nitrobacter sp.]|uniref:tetratricopeptide repeat protein n=1 Tax=Nitrobacter sp. TaxID=29420 RepID=UPI003F6528D7